MTLCQQQRIDDIVRRALELPTSDRRAFVELECQSQPDTIKIEVNRLLASYDESETTPLRDTSAMPGVWQRHLSQDGILVGRSRTQSS